MPKGFFQTSKITSKTREPRIASCGACKLNKGCVNPKLHTTGLGKVPLLSITTSTENIQALHSG